MQRITKKRDQNSAKERREVKKLGRKFDGRTGGSRSSRRRDGCTGVSYDGVTLVSSYNSKLCGGSSVRSLDEYV